jgi:hypothetical protein
MCSSSDLVVVPKQGQQCPQQIALLDGEDLLDSVPEREKRSELWNLSTPLLSLIDAERTASHIDKASSCNFSGLY